MKYLKKIHLNEGEELVCVGAGEVGEQFFQICKKAGIKISYFCDNDASKWGTYFCETPVFSLEELLAKSGVFVWVLSNLRFFEEIENQLEKNGIHEIYISVVEESWLEKGIYSDFNRICTLAQTKHRAEEKKNKKGVFLDVISIPVTQKCTLNCRHCVAGVPYVKNPKEMTLEVYKEAVDAYITLFDSIFSLNIAGAEPTTHKDLYEMIRYASQFNSIKLIRVFSNGTLLLDEEQVKKLDASKVAFQFTDYGELSSKLEENQSMLQRLEFPVTIVKHDVWYESTHLMEFFDYKEPYEEVVRKFSMCNQRTCHVLAGNHFMRCAMSSHADKKNTVPKDCLDWVDVDLNKRCLQEVKEELYEYMHKEVLDICRYCPGRTYDGKNTVPVAEQAIGKLELPPEYL